MTENELSLSNDFFFFMVLKTNVLFLCGIPFYDGLNIPQMILNDL